jgi:hypothetical protein
MSSPGAPTLAGFQAFIANVMAIPTNVLPTTAPIIAYSFQYALDTVNLQIAAVSTDFYTAAVYNLAGSNLLNFAPDQPGQNYFTSLRDRLKLNDFVPGVVLATADVSTSTTLQVQEAFKNLTISDLQRAKDPYGREYLSIAMRVGSLWGLS